MELRDERPGDEATIGAITAAAFAGVPYGDGTEAALIDALRADGDLTLSLVAVEGDDILGQVTLSPVTIGRIHDGWFGLGPISVAPHAQGQGIGSALVRVALRRLKASGAKGCTLVGDPAYYARFGFVSDPALTYSGVETRYVQYVTFTDEAPSGRLLYTPRFEAIAAGG